MSIVKVLVKGYVRKEGNNIMASSTTTLIQENGLNIIVDPGMNRMLLLESLEEEGLVPSDIDFIVLTHYHLDHSLLAGIFDNAKILDNGEIYAWDSVIKDHDGKIPGTTIKIFKTPGHDPFHCSVLLNTQEYGKVVIAGDVFWWMDGIEQNIDTEDPYVKDKKQLTESRNKILELADYIIPGHGKMFKVNK